MVHDTKTEQGNLLGVSCGRLVQQNWQQHPRCQVLQVLRRRKELWRLLNERSSKEDEKEKPRAVLACVKPKRFKWTVNG